MVLTLVPKKNVDRDLDDGEVFGFPVKKQKIYFPF